MVNNDPGLNNNLGTMYANGIGVQKDSLQACKLYEMAAKSGHVIAMNNLACKLIKNTRVEYRNQAIDWFIKAAEKGNVNSMINLGILYERGQEVEKDYAKALKWYKEAADNGNEQALYSIGIFYENGFGVEANLSKAVEYFKQAHLQDYLPATAKLGQMYYDGVFFQQDYQKAFELFYRAANRHYNPSGDAMNYLSSCYRYGLGTEKNLKIAEWYLEKAQLFGNDDANRLKSLIE